MSESATSEGAVLKDYAPAVDRAVAAYDLFIGEGRVTYVELPESSASRSISEARKLVERVEVAEGRALADAFTQRLANDPDVAEIWLLRNAEPLVLAVIVRELSLDRDLELRAVFADLMREYDAELRVYADSSERAELGQRGERLLG